jgi:hypothetical protein
MVSVWIVKLQYRPDAITVEHLAPTELFGMDQSRYRLIILVTLKLKREGVARRRCRFVSCLNFIYGRKGSLSIPESNIVV